MRYIYLTLQYEQVVAVLCSCCMGSYCMRSINTYWLSLQYVSDCAFLLYGFDQWLQLRLEYVYNCAFLLNVFLSHGVDQQLLAQFGVCVFYCIGSINSCLLNFEYVCNCVFLLCVVCVLIVQVRSMAIGLFLSIFAVVCSYCMGPINSH